jgi:hypothetical protein
MRIPTAAALALILASAIATPFWADLVQSVSSTDSTYAERRTALAFAGFPIDVLRAQLNERLAPETRIALGQSIVRSDFLQQRFTEGLYPRLVDKTSPFTLEIEPLENAGASALKLFQLNPKAGVFLRSSSPPPAGHTEDAESSALSIGAALISLLSALGFGFAALRILGKGRAVEPVAAPFAAVLLGALAIGLFNMFATWIQVPLPRDAIGIAGSLVAIALFTEAFVKKRLGGLRSRLWKGVKAPETLAFAAALGLYVFRVLSIPVYLWDGRSIWFFHAKKMFFHGMLSKADMLHPDFQWSHAIYPVLLPGWLNHFNLFSTLYNERMMSLGIPVLLGSALALVWWLARRQPSGARWTGAAFTFAVFLSIEKLSAGGYADGLVLAFVLLEYLAFNLGERSRENAWLGWTAAMLASLVKQEGFFLAIGIAGLSVMLGPLKHAGRQRFLGALVFVPALVHSAWVKKVGVEGVFHDIPWNDVFSDFFFRLGAIFEAIPGLLTKFPLLWEGAAGLCLAVYLWLRQRREPNWPAKSSIFLAAVTFAFFCSVLMLTPFDIRWHVGTSLDRLMLYPAAFSILGFFLFLTASSAE